MRAGDRKDFRPSFGHRSPLTFERQLEQLVAKFGEEKVRQALDPLITRRKWNDWQCVANAIRRIARQN
jgi:hypothetical protein